MDDLNIFLSEVESSTRNILAQQDKKEQDLLSKRVSYRYPLSGQCKSPAKTHKNINTEKRILEKSDVKRNLPALSHLNQSHVTKDTQLNPSNSLPCILIKSPDSGCRIQKHKLLHSPLYQSLQDSEKTTFTAIQNTLKDADQVDVLLGKLGLKSPRLKKKHTCEQRWCQACWVNPDRERMHYTGTKSPTKCQIKESAFSVVQNLHSKNSLSWSIKDLKARYRSKLPFIDQQTRIEIIENEDCDTIHPLLAMLKAKIHRESSDSLAYARKMWLEELQVCDLHEFWRNNMEHFNQHKIHSKMKCKSRHQETRLRSLLGRRDDNAIQNQYTQIQSISLAKALGKAFSSLPHPMNSQDEFLWGRYAKYERAKCIGNPKMAHSYVSLVGAQAEMKGTMIPKQSILRIRCPGHDLLDGDPMHGTASTQYHVGRDQVDSEALLVTVELPLDVPLHLRHVTASDNCETLLSTDLKNDRHLCYVAKFYSQSPSDLSFSRTPFTASPVSIICMNPKGQKPNQENADSGRQFFPIYDSNCFVKALIMDINSVPIPPCDAKPIAYGISRPISNSVSLSSPFYANDSDVSLTDTTTPAFPPHFLRLVHIDPLSSANTPFAFSAILRHEKLHAVRCFDQLKSNSTRNALVIRRHGQEANHNITSNHKEGRSVNVSAGQITGEAVEGWLHRLSDSTIIEEQEDWQKREARNKASFFYCNNENLALKDRFQWNSPSHWRDTEIAGVAEPVIDPMDTLTAALRHSKTFMDKLRNKLGIKSSIVLETAGASEEMAAGWNDSHAPQIQWNSDVYSMTSSPYLTFCAAGTSVQTALSKLDAANQLNATSTAGMLNPSKDSAAQREITTLCETHFVSNVIEDLEEKRRQCHVDDEALNLQRNAIAMHDISIGEENFQKAMTSIRRSDFDGLNDALEQRVDVNGRDEHGNTLFILACQQGNKRIARLLLRWNADPNAQNFNGNTALHYLHEYQHFELADYIISKGAEDTLVNAKGLTCYEGLSQEKLE